jgi:hypothetical protein
MNERAVMELMEILDGYEEPIGRDWPEHEQQDATFSHWAIDEILNLVWDHPWTPASDTIENFALKLEFFIAESKSEEQRRIFAIAAETAWEILETIKEVEK